MTDDYIEHNHVIFDAAHPVSFTVGKLIAMAAYEFHIWLDEQTTCPSQVIDPAAFIGKE